MLFVAPKSAVDVHLGSGFYRSSPTAIVTDVHAYVSVSMLSVGAEMLTASMHLTSYRCSAAQEC